MVNAEPKTEKRGMETVSKTFQLRDRILATLQTTVPERRLQHILRVETMAVTLAQCHGLDVTAAQLAGLLHDLAKCYPGPRLLAIAQAQGWTLDAVEVQTPHLLHGPVGAVIARETFAIDDDRILQAIAHHTLGHPAMDKLSCVVYLADCLEPGRGDGASLDNLRQLSREDLSLAVYETCRFSLRHLLESGKPIHPRTILTLNAFRPAKVKRTG
jgi:predicted HD superfamily hydrolase involved in NAD metabolism